MWLFGSEEIQLDTTALNGWIKDLIHQEFDVN